MSTPNPAKRRRLDDVTKTLKKPFVSPMRGPKAQTPLKENNNKANVTFPQYTPSTLAHTIQPAYSAGNPSFSHPPLQRPKPTPLKPTPTRKPAPWSSSPATDPEILAAQKAISSLEFRIKKVQNDLDTLKQASQITSSSTDAGLEALTKKWRLASQAVADELFGQVKERVQRMGGVAAWREMEQRKYERQNGMGEFAQPAEESDYEDCEFDSEGEELPEAEQEYRKKMKRQAKQEMMDAADVPDEPVVDSGQAKTKVWQEEGKDDDTFTVDMMLRSLNIDLKLIGYDKQAQRWI